MRRLVGILLFAVVAVACLSLWYSYSIRGTSPSGATEQAQSGDEQSDVHQHHASGEVDNGPEVDLTSQSNIHMEIKEYSFTRPNIKVKKGTKVTWTNQDAVPHNLMKEHEDADEAHEAPAAEDVKADVFAGPLLAKNQSYSFTFTEGGSYPYHCAPHPYMTGLVTVTD